MGGKSISLGFRSTRVEVIGVGDPKNSGGQQRPTVIIKCDCGSIKTVRWDGVRSGAVKSCGCLRKESVSKAQTKHGGCKKYGKTPEYSVWASMRDRCCNPRNNQYRDYGGRGIEIEWDDFDTFLTDMGKRKDSTLTIERRDTNGNYSKDNCYWATREVQNGNTRASKRWFVHGVWFHRAKDAAEANNVGVTTILNWCNGFYGKNKYYPPKDGCRSELKYPGL